MAKDGSLVMAEGYATLGCRNGRRGLRPAVTLPTSQGCTDRENSHAGGD